MHLQGAHLKLIPASIDMAEDLLPAFNGDEQFTRWSGHSSEMSLAQVHDDIQEIAALPDGITWGIADHMNTLVGVAQTTFHPTPRTGWIALLIIRNEFQGSGYGREAATLLENYLFSSPEVTEIGLGILVRNRPAQAFWEKRGYVRIAQRLDTHHNDCYEYRLYRPAVLRENRTHRPHDGR
jgi:RimJ/RimL family protein N-acetyltransferase